MLKQQRAVGDPSSPSTPAVYPTDVDRPRKKLSFREPEVVPQNHNDHGALPLSAPAMVPVPQQQHDYYHTYNTFNNGNRNVSRGNYPASSSSSLQRLAATAATVPKSQQHTLSRPHSIAGVFNLTGFSGGSPRTRLGANIPTLPASPLPQIKNFIQGKRTSERLENVNISNRSNKKSIEYNKSNVDRGGVECGTSNDVTPSRIVEEQYKEDGGFYCNDDIDTSIEYNDSNVMVNDKYGNNEVERRPKNNNNYPIRQTSRGHEQQQRATKKSTEQHFTPSPGHNDHRSTPTSHRRSHRGGADSSPTSHRKGHKSSSKASSGRSRSADLRNEPSRDVRANSVSLESLTLDSQAMRIVRTVGQAFEVCHKYSSSAKQPPPSPTPSDTRSDSSALQHSKGLGDDGDSSQEEQMTLTSDDPCDDSLTSPTRRKQQSSTPPVTQESKAPDTLLCGGGSLAMQHEVQLVRAQLEQQQQQTQAAVAQVHLLRDQLAAETAARLEAQARTHQLLVHNKELLEHIQSLVLQIRQLELLPSSSLPPVPPLPSTAPDSTTAPAPPTPSIQSSPRLLHQHQQHQLQQQLQHHQQQQQHIQHQLHQQLLLQQRNSSSSSEQSSSRESVTACIAGLFPSPIPQIASLPPPTGVGGVLGAEAQHSPSPLGAGTSSASFFSDNPTGGAPNYSPSRRLALVPEDSTLSAAMYPRYHHQPSPFLHHQGASGSLGTSPALGSSAPPHLGALNYTTPQGPITRAASERVPRQNTIAQLQRMAWARHTTK